MMMMKAMPSQGITSVIGERFIYILNDSRFRYIETPSMRFGRVRLGGDLVGSDLVAIWWRFGGGLVGSDWVGAIKWRFSMQRLGGDLVGSD